MGDNDNSAGNNDCVLSNMDECVVISLTLCVPIKLWMSSHLDNIPNSRMRVDMDVARC